MSENIEITVNGVAERVPSAATVTQIIEIVKENDKHLIVELNGRYMQPKLWDDTTLSAGDRLEIIHPLFGG